MMKPFCASQAETALKTEAQKTAFERRFKREKDGKILKGDNHPIFMYSVRRKHGNWEDYGGWLSLLLMHVWDVQDLQNRNSKVSAAQWIGYTFHSDWSKGELEGMIDGLQYEIQYEDLFWDDAVKLREASSGRQKRPQTPLELELNGPEHEDSPLAALFPDEEYAVILSKSESIGTAFKISFKKWYSSYTVTFTEKGLIIHNT